jgi:hypothetical protein
MRRAMPQIEIAYSADRHRAELAEVGDRELVLAMQEGERIRKVCWSSWGPNAAKTDVGVVKNCPGRRRRVETDSRMSSRLCAA